MSDIFKEQQAAADTLAEMMETVEQACKIRYGGGVWSATIEIRPEVGVTIRARDILETMDPVVIPRSTVREAMTALQGELQQVGLVRRLLGFR